MAIRANGPTRIVLNHLDYIDALACEKGVWSERLERFVRSVNHQIDRQVDLFGISPTSFLSAARPISPGFAQEFGVPG